MEKVDYFKIIQKYIEPGSLAYSLYVPHVVMVTSKALYIARKKGLSSAQLCFIEEAGMLHDIGIVRTDKEELGCTGELPYICHTVQGRKILEAEGLPRHGLVAERHTGVGLFKEDIEKNGFPLPARDYVAETTPEKIISWSDIFFSKGSDMLWEERTLEEGRATIAQYGDRHAKVFDEWADEFGV
jgi:uncharacterized protein